ncbi:MAG TPA: DEAD/DEAH box helicase [Solirubrobacterales bacterium]|nr:DEAD/DEAH box helicase [Solirubrobacterales bacterium]
MKPPSTATDLPWGSAVDEAWRAAIDPGRADGRLVAESAEREQEASEAPLPGRLHPDLRAALERVGIRSLYSHQIEALRASEAANVIVTSGTASGKSLAFNLPVLDTIARDPAVRALYLYPTKALAQDQARKLAQVAPGGGRPAIYDGDTPREERPAIRRRSNLILTNPDMLHVGILPHPRNWGDVFANLRFVVVDEAHVYRGVFGSHVANVLRRLRRIAARYGSEPRFILASATIANPVELAERLVGTPFHAVDTDAAPRAGRRIAIWNPPLTDRAAGARRSALAEAADMLCELTIAGTRTICFVGSRRGAELIHKFTSDQLAERGRRDLAAAIAPYRAGYTPEQRREVEARLAAGELRAVVATNALELGIDIGELDAAICVGFPGTVASLRQMWGRAGRRRDGLAVYLAGIDGLDQFFCRHPDEFLTRPVEAAILDPGNERIQSAHLVAAAFEAPLGAARDDEILGPGWRERAEALVAHGHLRRGRGGLLAVRGSDYPAAGVGRRSASADAVTVVDASSGELLGTVEAERAFSTVHPGAIYLHLGRSYEVSELDVGRRRAIVEPFSGDWYTQPRRETEIYIERIEAQRDVLGVELSFGIVSVSEQVIGFQRKRIGDGSGEDAFDFVALDLPEQSFPTQALWYVLPDELAGPAALPPDVQLGALHASEHTQIAVLPLLAMCDRWDIGGLSTNVHMQTGRPTIFIYDGHPGGVGISRRGYDEFERLVADAARLVGECPCADGCPSCVQSPKCGNLNDHLHKAGALELMGGMLGRGAAD